MAYQKLQVGRALAVIPSDDTLIPSVSTLVHSGTGNFLSASLLVDSVATTDFREIVNTPGAIVYNTGAGGSYNVSSVVPANGVQLRLDPATTAGAADAYDVYNAATTGCVLYVGVSGNLKVQTAGGDIITFANLPVGFVPVQVVKVFSTGTTATNIIALW